jgi:hypothetical protein
MNDLRVSFPKPCTEQWDDMRPNGCNRHCARCDHIIHDLSRLTLDEAEALLASNDRVCVRAEVASDGVVKLKAGGNRRRIVAAIGTSVGLLTATSPAFAADGKPRGAIKGEVLGSCSAGSVIASAADGRVYRAKIGINGRYKVKRLPDGSYEVKVENFSPEPPPSENTGPEAPGAPGGGQVTVEAGRTSILNLTDPNGCIVVGMIQLEDRNG